MTIQDIYVLGAARTPMGGLMGALSGVSAACLLYTSPSPRD